MAEKGPTSYVKHLGLDGLVKAGKSGSNGGVRTPVTTAKPGYGHGLGTKHAGEKKIRGSKDTSSKKPGPSKGSPPPKKQQSQPKKK